MMLTADEVDLSLVRNAKIFHFGSLSMTDKICENATKHAIAAAKEAGVLISLTLICANRSGRAWTMQKRR